MKERDGRKGRQTETERQIEEERETNDLSQEKQFLTWITNLIYYFHEVFYSVEFKISKSLFLQLSGCVYDFRGILVNVTV